MPSGESVGWLGCSRLDSVPAQPDRVGAVPRDADFAGGVDQIQVGHQLGHRGDHLRRQPVRHPAHILAAGGVAQQPFPQRAHRPVFDFGVDAFVNRVVDHARHFILLVRHGRAVAQRPQRHFGQHQFGRGAFGGGLGSHTRQPVAGFFLVGLAHQHAQVGEFVAFCRTVWYAAASHSLRNDRKSVF